MRLNGIPIGRLALSDLQDLVENRVGESRTLDFKETTPAGNEDGKKGFLADISAFANTGGGVILYGVRTVRDESGNDTGVAEALVGVGAENLDKVKQRLESLAHDSVSPSLAEVLRFQEIEVPGVASPILALGIPRSLVGPHRVVYNRSNRFYRRADTRNYEPDIPELRRMFLESASWIDEATSWRAERMRRVLGQEVYPRIITSPATFIHVLPLGRLGQSLDLASKEAAFTNPPLRPLRTGNGMDWRFNVDGFICFAQDESRTIASYTQVLRFGGVEGFTAFGHISRPGSADGIVWGESLEQDVPQYVGRALTVIHSTLAVDPPYAVYLSLHGTRGLPVQSGGIGLRLDRALIDQDVIQPPPAIIDDPGRDISTDLRPMLDVVWQSGGLARAPTGRR
jgi:hypothetical protein